MNKIEVWRKFCDHAGLTMTAEKTSSFPVVKGIYKGFDYKLNVRKEYNGAGLKEYTVITMEIPEYRDCNLYIYQKTHKNIMETDINTGSMEFDRAFIIKSQTPYIIPDLLTSELKRKMLSGRHIINMSLTGNKVENITEGIIGESQDLLYLSEIMWEFAMNACGESISDTSDDTFKKPSKLDIIHAQLQKKKALESDFTVDIHQNPSFLEKEKICPFCSSLSPAENKFCIECGREI
ncbi:MAG: zinc ribbon domain-containing protein [Candidatus Eremiobacterota bacterium]